MESNPFNPYLFKALESYPYDLSESVEALNYALSYEPENPYALYLMGRVYFEQLGDLEKARECLEVALGSRMELPLLYPVYLRILMEYEDYSDAERFLEFALKTKGSPKGSLMILKGQLLDRLGRTWEALKALKEARAYGVKEEDNHVLDNELQRIRKKLPRKKKGKGRKNG